MSSENQEVQKIFQVLWKDKICNVNVVLEVESRVIVKTFFPFNDTTAISINEYENGKYIKSDMNFYPDKTRNLYNSPIRVAITNSNMPLVLYRENQEGDLVFSGSDINVIKTLAESLNFEINYTYFGPEGFLLENGTAEGPWQALVDGTADLIISDFWYKENRMKFFDSTVAYINDQIIFIIPPGRELSSIEKMIYPLDISVWIIVLICFLIGFIVIFVVKQHSKRCHEVVFGESVQNPYLNLFIGFIGGSQNALPRKSFARFLLMVLLMYSLVIRAVYQGSYFELLRSHKLHRVVQSVDEMVAKNFSFFIPFGNEDLFKGADHIKNRFVEHVNLVRSLM